MRRIAPAIRLDRFATWAETPSVKTSSGGRYDATDAAGRAHRRRKHSGFGVAARTRMTWSGAAYRAASVRHGPPWPLPTMVLMIVWSCPAACRAFVFWFDKQNHASKSLNSG